MHIQSCECLIVFYCISINDFYNSLNLISDIFYVEYIYIYND